MGEIAALMKLMGLLVLLIAIVWIELYLLLLM